MPYLIDANIWKIITAAGRENSLERELICAVIEQESAWNPDAVGDNGRSFGLMQLNLDGAGAGKDEATLKDPESNIHLGSQYLASCMEATGNMLDAVSAYNQGIAGWQKRGQAGDQAYVNGVNTYYDNYKSQGIKPREGGEVLIAFDPYG